MIMKIYFLFFALIFMVVKGFCQGKPANDLFEEAIDKAKKEKKNVFVIFTATWCTPCKYLKRGISDAYNAKFFEDNYVILPLYSSYVDIKKGISNEGANHLLAKYGGDTTAIPYWLILNPLKQKLHGQLDFSGDQQFLKNFVNVIKKTSRLSTSELQMLYDRFRQLASLVPED